jgi:monomeric isocitrate dehydrogenase
MNQFPFLCEHTCRNTCSALTRALQYETSLVRLSEEIIQQCDDADIKEFMRDLARNSSESIIRIMQKMNEVQARTQILDGISASFEPHPATPPKPH